MNELTQEQIEVLFEFVEFTKREFKAYHPVRKKAMLYDHKLAKAKQLNC